MDVVPVGEHNIHGLVVPVDTDGSDGRHRLRASASLQVPKAPVRPATTDSGALIGQMHLGGSEHKLIGSPDDQLISTQLINTVLTMSGECSSSGRCLYYLQSGD